MSAVAMRWWSGQDDHTIGGYVLLYDYCFMMRDPCQMKECKAWQVYKKNTAIFSIYN